MSLPASLKQKIAAEVERTPSLTRPELAWRSTMVTSFGVAIAAFFFGIGAGPTLGGRAPMFVWPATGILLALALWQWIAASSSSLRASIGAAKRLAVLPYATLAVIAIAYAFSPALPHNLAGDIPCGAKTMLLAAIVGIATMFARRGTEPVRPSVKAMLLGGFAATLSATMVFLACPYEEPLHFLLGHLGGAIVIGGVLGLLATKVVSTK